MKAMTMKVMVAAVVAWGMSFNAYALTITPSTAACGSPTCLFATGNETGQNAIDAALEALIGTSDFIYKSDVGQADSGSAADWYNTAYFNTPLDPSDADITWVGPGVIGGGPIYLLVKNGNHTPAWYLFNISNWNGTETIQLQGFWPDQGAISHVAIYGGTTTVPDGGSMAMLLGMALMGLAGARRMLL
jgi:hypothetical protein